MKEQASNRRIRLWQWGFLLLLIVGTVVILKKHAATAFFRDEGSIFGTIYHIEYEYNRNLKADIEDELARVDNSLSMFNPRSVISRVNNGEDIEVDTMFVQVFRLAREISQATSGAFDITVAPLVQAWGFGFEHADNLTPHAVDSIRSFVGYEKAWLDGRRVVKTDPRVSLDCSAIAKGYGVDRVALLFDRLGIRNYMVEIGGEVVVKGTNSKQETWRIGVSRPVTDTLATTAAASPQAILAMSGRALATSGNYRRFYYREGRRYAHTIDPRTGYPVQHSLLSASVLAADCATADAYATAFMVMGMDSAKVLLREHPDLDAFFIYEDGEGQVTTWHTPGLDDLIVKQGL